MGVLLLMVGSLLAGDFAQERELLNYASIGDREYVRRLLIRGIDIVAANRCGKVALMNAIEVDSMLHKNDARSTTTS